MWKQKCKYESRASIIVDVFGSVSRFLPRLYCFRYRDFSAFGFHNRSVSLAQRSMLIVRMQNARIVIIANGL